MGKRKSARKQTKKAKETLSKTFACVFCNHENTVTTRMDHDNKIGHLTCSACAVNYSCVITVLSEPIDVYSEWIDACENVQETQAYGKDADQASQGDLSDDDF